MTALQSHEMHFEPRAHEAARSRESDLRPASHGTSRIGAALSRVDGVVKVTGQAKYAADHAMPDLLHGWVVSSAVAKGKITAIRDTAARGLPGVVEVITHLNRPHLPFLDRNYDDEVAVPGSPFRALYDDKIAFSGQPIALVIGTSLEAARDGAALVEVGYAAEAHNTDLTVAMPDKYEPKKKRDNFQMPTPRGFAQGAYDVATVKHSATYHLPSHHHNPMEMHGATVVWEGSGKITVHDKTQGSQNVQGYLASVFGFSKDDVRVLNPYVGGGFGSGLRPQYHVYLATLAAKMLERSVRVSLTRQQMFTHVHRPEALQTISLATDGAGKLKAILNDATTATSQFEDYMEVVCNWGLMNYACDNASGEYTLAKIDTYTPGDMRAPGAATGMTLFEIAIDEMAFAAGVDPLEFRRINYSDINAMNQTHFTSKALREAYEEGAARFGWSTRSAEPRSMRDGSELVGWGLATGMWDAMFVKTSARATLFPDGRLEVASATSDIGTGTYTVMTQVASECMGVAVDRITAKLGDSRLPTAPVEGGSWGAASTGAAIHVICEALRKKLFDAAAKLESKPLDKATFEDIEFRDGGMGVRANAARFVRYEDLFEASGAERYEAEGRADPGMSGKLDTLRRSRNTHSAIFAEVKVDEELGVVRVTRIVIAVAAGRIINPKTARSQILGGVVMGIGMALHEESLVDHKLGRFMNHSFAEYHIPANADVDDIEVIFVSEPDPDVTPLGVKGLGEIGIVGTAAAVANAIFHATGKRVRDLPVTIDKLL